MTVPSGADPLRDLLQARLGAQYEIERLLGQGGMGSVFLARDRTLDRQVAIKVIGGDVTTNVQLRERFLLEARTVAKLRHPNLVAVYSAGDADGLLYFVMEYVPGESLRDLLTREGKVEKGRAERILHEMSLALDYAHANGIVHRDVKPENILLDRDTGRAMLTDFGVARALEGDGRMTGTGLILGSPRYMSPEQASGETTLDGRSDLYSLALVGYEMFTGKPVVESGNIAGMLVKHLTETPKPLADAVVDVPEGAATAIDRALAKDRTQRWASGREMAEVIGMAWTPGGITPGMGTRALAARGVAARRRRAMGAGIAVGALVAVVAIGAWLIGRDRGDPRKSYAVVPFDIQTGNADVQWLRDGAVNMLTLALGQWRDLTVADYERTLALVREEDLESRRVDLAAARKIAERAGAGTVVMGLVTTANDSMHVQATLYDVRSGEALPDRTKRLSAALGADPRGLFDELARYLLDAAGGSPSASVELARATTTSIEAYRSYLDGVRMLNSWRLREADSAFQVAIRADSTFALAWHKRSLALGWGDAGGAAYVESAQRAMELADRLPAREQALARGHHALVRSLRGQMTGGDSIRAGYREAQRIFSGLLATDSLVAEAWYGLGDAYFHDNQAGDSLPDILRRINGSLRGFHRTLELDSTFHLAYSHLLQYYQQFSQPNQGIVIDGDSVLYVGDSAALRRAGGPAGVAARIEQARLRGLEIARGWMRADADAPAPYLMLTNQYLAAGMADSAVRVMDRALARPSVSQPAVRSTAAVTQLLAKDPRAYETMRSATGASMAELRRANNSDRIGMMATSMTVAGASGDMDEVARLVDLFSRVDSTLPFSAGSPTRPMLEWYALGFRLALGAPVTPEVRRQLAAGIRGADTLGRAGGNQLVAASSVVPFVAYLATRDTTYSSAVRRWNATGQRHTDLDGLEALARGDTAAARTIAATYTRPDSLAQARFSMAGLRTIARAEVLLGVGDTTRALAYFEALEPARFNLGLIEPGFAAYGRTFAARARIYEDRRETAKAIDAWERYLAFFEHADEVLDAEKAEARAALRRLREARR